MLFRNSPPNRAMRMAAAVVIMAFSGVSLVSGSLFGIVPGLLILTLGTAILIQGLYESVRDWRSRPSRYDLSELKRIHTDIESQAQEPTVESDPDEMLYCHRCGASMSQAYSICPDCGGPLGR
jgi:hypothetical protein